MSKIEYTLSKIFLNFFYFFFSFFKVDKEKIVFASPRSVGLEGNLKYIYEELKKDQNLNLIVLLDKYSYSLIGKISYLFRLLKGAYHLATAKVFIVDNAYFPVHILKHKKETKVIQVWHAAGAFKKFGFDVVRENSDVENLFIHKNYDYVIVGSDFSKKHYSKALDVDINNTLALGVARTDLFFNKNKLNKIKENFYKEYPNLKEKKIILYAPTFRGSGKAKNIDFNIDINLLKEQLGSEYILLYKPHPSVNVDDMKDDNFVKIIKNQVSLEDLMIVCDILISDYSSLILEYALLKKPLILYVYDIKEYENDPGFYFNFKNEIIGEIAYNSLDILKIIKQNKFDFSYYDKFINTHFKFIDGESSKRISEYIIDNLIN